MLRTSMESHLKNDLFRPRLKGVIFGAEDYAQATGITRTPELIEMTYARQKLVSIAKAYNLLCFDLVCPLSQPIYKRLPQVSTNFRDLDALKQECEQGASWGFTGKQAIHPSQIDVIHTAFSPSPESITNAKELLTQYLTEISQSRRGAWEFKGKMVDRPVIRHARRQLTIASSLNIDKEGVDAVLCKVREAEEQAGISEEVIEEPEPDPDPWRIE
jgi:citrate lyase subunit beta-like protein